MATQSKIIDADAIIKAWAKNWYEKHLRKSEQKRLRAKLPWDELVVEIDKKSGDEQLRLEAGDPNYELLEGECKGTSKPRTYILLKSSFVNKTSEVQEHLIKTERKTKSTCTFSITEGCKLGQNFSLKLATPLNPVIEANVGFTSEVSVSDFKQTTSERELTWAVDSQIKVPAKSIVTAELEIQETEYSGNFEVKTYLKGQFEVKLSKNNKTLAPIRGRNLQTIFKSHGFQEDSGGIFCMTKGKCHFRYGVEQKLKIHEEALNDDETDQVEN